MRLFTCVILCVLPALSSGCLSMRGDRLADPKTVRCETKYAPNAIYRLRKPVFLRKWPLLEKPPLIPAYILETEGQNPSGVPNTVADYYRDGPKEWPQVVTVLPAGTHIAFKEVRIIDNDVYGRKVNPLGIICEEKLMDIGLVDFSYITDFTGLDCNGVSIITVSAKPEYVEGPEK